MTNPPLHTDLAAGRWQQMSLMEQLGNIGSEVSRTLKAKANNNPARAMGAFARALELFDLTAQDARWRGPRLREILRAREYFCSTYFAHDNTNGDAEFLDKYFLQFAVAARKLSGRA